MCMFDTDPEPEEDSESDLYGPDVIAMSQLAQLAHLNLGNVAANDEILTVRAAVAAADFTRHYI